MTWLTWRQHRTAVLSTALGLGAIALAAHQYSFALSHAAVFMPLIAGVFWGAPLVARELEQQTYLVVWTQSISRRRWFASEVAFVLGLTIAASALLAWICSSVLGPSVLAPLGMARFDVFDAVGIVPISYSVFGLSLGVGLGVFIKRVIPAMGATLVVWVAVRLGVLNVRRYFAPALRVGHAIGSDSPRVESGAWVIASHLVSHGQPISGGRLSVLCPTRSNSCLSAHGIHLIDVFQPANRYWQFQLTEASIFLGLSIAVLGVAAYRLNRRLN